MATVSDPLDRAEKATSLARNLVIIVGAIATILIFTWDLAGGRVTAKAYVMLVPGERFIVADRDRLSELLKLSSGPERARDSQRAIGRLDRLANVQIHNGSKNPVNLVIRIYNAKFPMVDPTDVAKGEFMKSSFAFIDILPGCPLQDKPLTIGDQGMIWQGATGVLEVKDFAAGCSLQLLWAEVRTAEVVLNIVADGRLVRLDIPWHIYGPVGRYAALIVADPPWTYLWFLLLPAVLIIAIAVSAAQLIARVYLSRRRNVSSGVA